MKDNFFGDNVVDFHTPRPPTSTRSTTVREVRELVDDDRTGLMSSFIAQAIVEYAGDVVRVHPDRVALRGSMAELIWPTWVDCAKQILAKRKATFQQCKPTEK